MHLVLDSQQKIFEEENPFVRREKLAKLKELLPLEMPIIIAGIRRCGKSSLMKQLKDELNLGKKQFLYVDFNDERLSGFSVKDFQSIEDFTVENNYEKECFLFLDEIQEVDGWEKWVNREKSRFRIIVSGSNSKLNNSEISTTLTGRTINLNLFPFSFKEYLSAKKIDFSWLNHSFEANAKMRGEFGKYLKEGGFPLRVITGKELIIRELYENILYKDIIKRFGRKEKQLRELSAFLLANPASKFSFREMAEMLGIKNRATVKNLVYAFEKAFVFFYLSKYDYSIKKQIQNPQKQYCIDNGFLTALGFSFMDSSGKLLENLVAIELKRRSKETYYFNGARECDFLTREGNKITQAIQVTWKLTPEDREREISGLLEAMEKFKLKKGLIITSDGEEEISNGKMKIKVTPAWKWLLLG